MFGSSIEDRCTEESDIDIAVFGNQPKGKALTSKQFIRFADKLSEFDDFLQRYDILYDNPKNYKSVFLVKTGGAS